MSAQQCLDIIREAGGDLTDNEIEQLLEELQRRQRLNEASGKFIDSEESALAAAQQMGKDMKLAAAIAKREAADNEVKFLKAVSLLDSQWSGAEGASKGEGIAALIYGSNKAKSFGRSSVMNWQAGTKDKLSGAFFSDLMAVDKEADRMLSSGAFDKELFRAIYDIRQGKTPTGSELVPELAQVIVKHQEYWRNTLNENGAWIGKLDDYVTTRSHSPSLIQRAGFEQWKADITQHLDWSRTLQKMPDKDENEFLANVYKGLVYGHHMKSGDDKGGFQGASNLAKKLSQERVLHFKGPEAEFEYAQKYANGNLAYMLMRSLEHTSQSVGLMKVLGANPGSMIERLVKHVNDTTPTGITPTERYAIDNALKSVDGTMATPVNETLARFTANVNAFQRMAKLGGMLISQLGDVAFRMSEFKRNGMTALDAVGSQVEGLLTGLGPAERREALLMIGGYADAFTAEASRAMAVDPLGGTLAKWQDRFFRMVGAHWWQQGSESSAAIMLAQNMARQTDKDFGQLPGYLGTLLRQHGIGEAEWQAIRQSAQNAVGDTKLITPEGVKVLPNAAIQHLVQNDIDALHERTKDAIGSLNEKIGKEAEWQAGRKTKLAEYSAKLGEALNRFMGTRDAKRAERADYVDATKELMQARLDRAAAEADIASYLAAEKQQNQIKDFLDAVESGKRPEKLSPSVDRNVQRNIRESGNRGQALGEKIGRAERRMVELEKNLRDMERTFDSETKSKFEELTKRLDARAKEMDDFLNASVERQARYADLANQWESSVTRKENRIYDKMREELSDRMRNYYTDRVGFAAIKPDAKTNAILLQGTQPGTAMGAAARFVALFKSTPAATIQKGLGAALYTSGADTLGQAVRDPKAMASTVGLVLQATLMGYASMYAKDLIKGKEPRDAADWRTFQAALLQGGGMGIYGDFLFGEAKSRTGGGFLSTVAGPVGGTVEDISEIRRRMLNGDDAAAKTFNTVLSNTPFMNVFYLRPVLDYAILHSLTEAMNPGALRRREALVTKENEQGWLRRPSENFADPLGLTR